MTSLKQLRALTLLLCLAGLAAVAPVTAEEAPAATGDVTKQLIPIRLMDMNHNGKLEESDMAEYGRKLVGLYVDEATKDIRTQMANNPDFMPVFIIPLLKNLRRMADIDRMRAKLLGDIANELGNLDTNRDGVLDNQEFKKMAFYVTGSKPLFRDLDGEEAKGFITEDDLQKAEAIQTVADVLRTGGKAYTNNAKPLFLRDKKAEVSMTTEDVSLIQRYFRDAQTIYVKRSTGMDFLVGVIENEQKIQLLNIKAKIQAER
ncbi:MAG TPA: hypothetical protein VL860_08440 [Planctomycetota bacterium]|jgi:hypothetical protein|nr:hypothetical protein [Planctomycetota bacterium]